MDENIAESGEAASADKAAVFSFSQTFKDMREEGGDSSETVLNVDRTGLFMKNIPNRSFIIDSDGWKECIWQSEDIMINGKLFVIFCCILFNIVTGEDEEEFSCNAYCENEMDFVFCLFSEFRNDVLDILYDCARPFIPENSNYFAIYYIFFTGDVDIYHNYAECMQNSFTDEQKNHLLNVAQDCSEKYPVILP
ncbi:uncharacterized protein [Centruroides vittatus]|uniref:uncharacterized protein n=1 Tax=Centruroides vittatus TaxID=120091 RepID=UPI00350FED0F